MEPDRLPALLPAVGVLVGAFLGLRLHAPHLLLLVALAGCGVGLGGRRGGRSARRLLIGLSLGWTAAAVTPPADAAAGLDPRRPVTVVGRVVSHWRDLGEDRSAVLALERRVQRRVQRRRPALRGGAGAGDGRGGGPRRSAVAVRVGGGPLPLVLPGREPPPAVGSRLRLRGYLRRSAGYANAVPVPPGPWRLRVSSRRLLTVEGAPGPAARLAARLRGTVERALGTVAAERPRGGEGLAFVRALLLGDSGEVPEAWRRGLRRSGLAHLLAVSGLHVGMVGGLVWLLAWPLPRPSRLAVALAAVGGYLLLVGPRPSLLRAAAMVALAAVAVMIRRGPSGANTLAVIAAVLVLRRPALVYDVGFRLTFAATAGLLLLAPRLVRAWSPPPPPAGESLDAPHRLLAVRLRRAAQSLVLRPLAATCAAQLVSLPFAAPVFHLVSWTAPAANLLAVPWTALFLATALGWTGWAVVSPRTAAAGVPLLDALAVPFGLPAAGPPAVWGVVPVAAPATVAALFAAVAVWGFLRPRRRWLAGLLIAVCLLPAFRWGAAAAQRGRPRLAVAVLDVGQGDAILLRDGGRAVLVDGGGWWHGDFGGRVLVPALVGEGIGRLDAVVLSHPDRDHCGGLVDLASYLPIGEVWTAPGWERRGCGGELVRRALGERAAEGDPRLLLWTAGDRRAVGRWRFTALHPPSAATVRRVEGDNDRSLVLMAAAGGRRLLLTGDVESRAERRLVRVADGRLGADFLKLAHHGSRTSSGRAFLAAVAPRLALVSAGRHNPYGHPAQQVVDRLARLGIPLLRTDLQGRIELSWRPEGSRAGAALRIRLGRLGPGDP